MSWARWFRLREHLRMALWPVPCVFGLGGLLLGMLAWRVDRWAQWALWRFEPEGATALCTAIVGATLTFLGTAFSILLLVVQFASAQLTPRALRVSLSDPLYRISLGLFVATFVFTMVMLGRITPTFVPQLGMALAALLVIGSLAAYVVLISHMRRSLRPVVVATSVGRQARRTLERIYPETLARGAAPGAVPRRAAPRSPARVVASPGPPGLLVAFDAAGLVAEGRRADATLTLVPAVGDFVRSGSPLFHVSGPSAGVDERRLLDSVALGQERMIEHDPAFAFRILVDVALKALSPAINDPTSAVMAIDQLHELLALVGGRRLDVDEHRDGSGEVRLAVEMPSWEDYVSLAFDEIRTGGAGQVQVMRRLRAMLDDLLEHVPDDRKVALRREVALLEEGIQRTFADDEDRTRAREADPQGIGSSPRAPR